MVKVFITGTQLPESSFHEFDDGREKILL